MLLKPSKNRLLCSVITVGLIQASGMATSQPLPEAASTMSAPGAALTPTAAPPVADATAPFYPLVPESAAHSNGSADNQGMPTPLRVMYSDVGIDGSRMKPVMNSLRIVGSKSTQNLVAQQVALNVALMVLSGGLAFGIRPFSKEDLAGIEPEGSVDKTRLQNPALFRLPAELEKRSTMWLAANEKTKAMTFKNVLVVASGSWTLVYRSLLDKEETYQLKFDVGIYKSRDKPSFFTGDKRGGKACEYISDARPLIDWKANDYQAVSDAAPLAIEKCSAEFTAQLPQLLELE